MDHFSPHRLRENRNIIFRGPTIGGQGFILGSKERKRLISEDPRSQEIIKPFLTGQDINQEPNQQAPRYAIDFEDFEEEKARQYEACWKRLFHTVRLQRKGNKIERRELYWWQYIGRQVKLYRTIKSLDRILACGEVSKYWSVSWVDPDQVFAGKVVVFALSKDSDYAILNSCFHIEWAEKTSSRLKGDPSYSLAKTFETFPRPESNKQMENIGEIYHKNRRQLMLDRQEGLTTAYNRFHDPDEKAEDIVHLRELQVEMDHAVAAAYGWQDLALDHGFHETAQGIRYTISEAARREVLTRLLKLNHQRYAEEVKAGLHEKQQQRAGAKNEKKERAKKNNGQMSLF
jgi:hypothetical protein